MLGIILSDNDYFAWESGLDFKTMFFLLQDFSCILDKYTLFVNKRWINGSIVYMCVFIYRSCSILL